MQTRLTRRVLWKHQDSRDRKIQFLALQQATSARWKHETCGCRWLQLSIQTELTKVLLPLSLRLVDKRTRLPFGLEWWKLQFGCLEGALSSDCPHVSPFSQCAPHTSLPLRPSHYLTSVEKLAFSGAIQFLAAVLEQLFHPLHLCCRPILCLALLEVILIPPCESEYGLD